MTQVKFLQDTDIGNGLDISTGKLIPAAELSKYDDNSGLFSTIDNSVRQSAYKLLSSDKFSDWKQYAFYRPLSSSYGINFEEFKSLFEQTLAAYPDMNRFVIQELNTSYVLAKDFNTPEYWSNSLYKQGGVNGLLYPYSRVVQDNANPLFIAREYNSNKFNPADPTQFVSKYNIVPELYMRYVAGASATLEFVTPQKIAQITLLGVSTEGYIQSPLLSEVTYIDDTTEIGNMLPYNMSYYLSNAVDQNKLVKSVKFTVPNFNPDVGSQSTTQLDESTGKIYLIGDSGFGNYTNVHRLSYMYPYGTDKSAERFVKPSVDVTDKFNITTSITPATGTSIANMTDGNDTSVYQASTNSASLSLTLTRNVIENIRPNFIRLTLLPNAGNELALSTLQSIVFTGSVGIANSNLVSNTRWYRNVIATADKAFTVDILASLPSAINEIMSKLTLTLTKLDTTKPFRISSINVFGSVD